MRDYDYDTIVVGAGPAGSTTSALLAEKGHKVVMIEKDKFPRYHVGESLMPFCYFTLERLGLVEKMNDIGLTKKFSVQFVTEDGSQSKPFYFFQHYDHPSSTTWQVMRSEFDNLIMEKARNNGTEIRELTKAKSLIKEDGNVVGINVENEAGKAYKITAPIVVDASGRNTFAQNKLKWKKKDPKLNKVATWTYFKGALKDPGLDAGSTTVAYLPGKGWFWYIPLEGDIVSVGIVAEKDYIFSGTKDLAEIFKREIQNNEWIKNHLESATQFGKYWSTGEYSYRSEFCADDGLLLVGDAFAFLDPVFSSGVFLALKSGEMAADAISNALISKDYSANQFEPYGKELCHGIESMRALVYAFYDDSFSFADLIKSHPDMRSDLTDCLIGDVFKDFTKLFGAVSDFANVPTKLPHGLVA